MKLWTKEQYHAVMACIRILNRDANDMTKDMHERAESENAVRDLTLELTRALIAKGVYEYKRG
jgi:hypothetical protein